MKWLGLGGVGWLVGASLATSVAEAAPGADPLAVPTPAAEWSEGDYYLKTQLQHPFVIDESAEIAPVIGHQRFYQVRKGDTFSALARFYGLGLNEMLQANPGIDPWLPPEGQMILLPKEWILPETERKGVVVNIPEMRLYYFHRQGKQGPLLVSTYPVGLGRDEWKTPRGSFRIRGKTENPTWVIPESIRQERIAEKGFSERAIPGDDPRNPLGEYRLELTMPSYAIHGTNNPWGVGMQVSHGCIRMYPEDIQQLFPEVAVGTAGAFIYQPVKLGERGGRIYVEVHPDVYTLTEGLYLEARRLLSAHDALERVDEHRLRRAIAEVSGAPIDITAGAAPIDLPEEDL